MVYISMKMGPKGQVVVPKPMRDEFGMGPGDEIIFGEETTHGTKKIVLNKKENKGEELVKFLEESSRKYGIKNFKYDSDKAYEEMMEERFAPLLKKIRAKK